ncbi:putative ABC transport system permease protein [Tindallia californiensis]|uniref:Putative ABC transport system permease protein n=2 Tax=Tindallia californiensis TaxID=159292 RepID=A0A1H3LHY8_9FIRM|nr:putative ABC transport system permease protein [Tindallia californiensis]
MSPLMRRLFRMIISIKGQVISIVVVMALALMSFISTHMTAENLQNSIDLYYQETNLADLQVELTRIPSSAIYDVVRLPEIKEVQGRISVEVPLIVEDPDENVRVRLVSVPEAEQSINALFPIEGKMIQRESDAATVLEQFATGRDIKLGHRVRPYINGREVPLEVIGIAGQPEFVYLMEDEQNLLPDPEKFGVIFVAEAMLAGMAGYQDSYNELLITLVPGAQASDVADLLEDELDRYGLRRVLQREDMLSYSMMEEELNQVRAMSRVLPTLFMLVAALIIYIVLSRTVKNDRMSIGIMKALGYSDTQILMHYVQFSILVGIGGSILGIIGGTWVSDLFTQIYIEFMNIPMLEMRILPESYLLALVITVIFCVLAGVAGAYRTLSIQPADAMRPEPPTDGHRLLIEKIPFFWNRIAFSWKIVIRNLFRNKRRYAVLALGITLTFGVTMVAINMGSVWQKLFDEQYGEIYAMDYIIDFDGMKSHQTLREIQQMADVTMIEARIEMPLEIRHHRERKSLSVIGIPRESQLYQLKKPSGEPLIMQDGLLYLTAGLKKSMGIQKGDQVLARNFLPDKDDFWIEVGDPVLQYLGFNGYATLTTMEEKVIEADHISGVSLKSEEDISRIMDDAEHIRQVQSVGQMREMFEEFSELIVVTIGILVILGGVIGFAIVYNITLISINERMMEFSSLRVLGFHRREIFRMITRENTLVSFLGILLGIPFGKCLIKWMMKAIATEVYTMPAEIGRMVIPQTIAAVISFVAIAQLSTFIKIRNLNFMEALKNRVT